jgi:hypothetical protein
MGKGNSEYEMPVRQREEFLNEEAALSTTNGMIGMVDRKLRDKAALTRDMESELESQLKLLNSEFHLPHRGDMAVRKKAWGRAPPS